MFAFSFPPLSALHRLCRPSETLSALHLACSDEKNRRGLQALLNWTGKKKVRSKWK